MDAYPDTTFKGKVWQKRQAPITVQNVVTYDVVIQVDNRDLKLMPGMTANVSVIITTKHDVLRLTNAAMRFRMTDRSATAGAGRRGAGARQARARPRRKDRQSGSSRTGNRSASPSPRASATARILRSCPAI